MLTDHINKCRTAGCGFLLTCVICFQPLLSLALCSHISTETNLDHVCKTNLLQCDLPALHCNVRTKLSLCRSGYHTIDLLARFQCTDHIQNKCLGTDRTKWTFVDTVTTADTLALINYGNTKIIVCNGIYQTCKLTWTFQMSDSIVRACLGTHTALFTFIGINVGTLGYLTEVEASEYGQALDTLIRGEYYLEKRMMLCGEVFTEEGKTYAGKALNDIVISRQGVLRVVNFQIFVNGRYLNSYNADGIIFSTPTGSTGYSLSAGGPIVSPSAEMTIMTPVAPHTLNTRSVIFPAEDVITVEIGKGRHNDCEKGLASFDGDTTIPMVTGDCIIIRRADAKTRILKLNHLSFVEVLRRKMRDS